MKTVFHKNFHLIDKISPVKNVRIKLLSENRSRSAKTHF